MQHKNPVTAAAALSSDTPALEALLEIVAHSTVTAAQSPLTAGMAASPATVHAARVLHLHLHRRLHPWLRVVRCRRMGLVVGRRGTPV